jgi:hypothetical protein
MMLSVPRIDHQRTPSRHAIGRHAARGQLREAPRVRAPELRARDVEREPELRELRLRELVLRRDELPARDDVVRRRVRRVVGVRIGE